MARIFTDGAEMGDMLFWTWTAPATNVGVVTSPVRTGTYSYYTQSGQFYKAIPPSNEIYYRFCMALNNTSGGNNTFLKFMGSSQSVTLDSVYYDATKRFKYYSGDGSVLLATGSIVTDMSQFILIETYLKIADSPNGRFISKVNGVLDCDFTGDTQPAAVTTIDGIYYTYLGGITLYLDDLALNDTSGTEDNSWCGDGRIYKITPSGSSATTNNWINSGSVSGSANYLYVDEYPADGDTTYVYCSGSNTGTQDQYAMTNLGLSPTTKIYRVWTEARAKKTDASDTYIKLGILPSGGTDSVSGSIPLTTAYTAITGSAIKINPFTSASWTNADLDGLEAVIEMG